MQRSEVPSGYETTGLENFKGKVLRGIKTGDLHLNVALVRSLDSVFVVDGQHVEIDSIAHEIQASEKRVSRNATPKIDPDTGAELEVQRWMRPKVKNIVGMDLAPNETEISPCYVL